MRLRSIGLKLALLAGIPVLGAVLLSLAIFNNAFREMRKAESLGSVDSVAELSGTLSRVVAALQAERASRAMLLGETSNHPDANEGARDAAGPAAVQKSRVALAERERDTDGALLSLDGFLASRDLSRFPDRLREPLAAARVQLQELHEIRAVKRGESELDQVNSFYGATAKRFIDATAALTELSDDGELLRLFTALVSVHDIKERASEEHAVLAYVFSRGTFPPGSYRTLVTVVTEQEVYEAVFRTNASREQVALFDSKLTPAVVDPPERMRQQAMEATEEDIVADPTAWFEQQRTKVAELATVADDLNARVRTVATAKRAETQRVVAFSAALVGGVLVLSVLLAYVLGRGISSRVTALRDATQRVGEGDLSVRVTAVAGDELGQLGAAFNRMIQEIADARVAQLEQARISREVEIAASIQSAMLPPAPTHPDFEFAGRMEPADEVGGDFYDVLTDETHLWLTVGDVSNHGLSAGLVMLMAQSTFAGFFSSDPEAAPDTVIRGVNRVLHANISDRLQEDKYLTAQLLAYRGEGRFSCAGAHEWPIVFRARTARCEVIPASGPWLGILPHLDEVPVSELVLEPGDVLCLYSDGLTEARDGEGRQFDVPRLASTLEVALGGGASLEEALDAAYGAVRAHAEQQDDDWSMLLVRRQG